MRCRYRCNGVNRRQRLSIESFQFENVGWTRTAYGSLDLDAVQRHIVGRGFRVQLWDVARFCARVFGIHQTRPGWNIGRNAAAIPLPSASLDGMTLHCAFEHFEGNADSQFIRECARLLKSGGKAVILTLYVNLRWTNLQKGEVWRCGNRRSVRSI